MAKSSERYQFVKKDKESPYPMSETRGIWGLIPHIPRRLNPISHALLPPTTHYCVFNAGDTSLGLSIGLAVGAASFVSS